MSDDELDEVPFSKRPDWADVVPIEQDDGPNPICPIAYKDDFKEKLNYFRAIIKSNEKSSRALELTDSIIQDCPSNYTVWYYRREILKVIDFDLQEEFDYVGAMGESDPKNYQIWNHRRWLVETYNDNSRELEFIAERLQEDGKNYHAWGQRQWVLTHFKLSLTDELAFVDKMLKTDHRNNSAWNQRYFVIAQQYLSSTPSATSLPQDVIKKEVDYAVSFIKYSPNNESPWSYLRGLYNGTSLNDEDLIKLLVEMKGKYIGCAHVLSLLIDIYVEQNKPESLTEAVKICTSLMNNIDQIHRNYWQYRLSSLESKLNSLKQQ
ncbi:protein prenyltransferase alpha subunit [Cavenderia fasciculata]|uniref:Protein farnesyltransferase/geranylgeranyltransferase type-1 subunit alpha n=1 Tax=Cavenderia fasciculata TaxID=261658 RepID=F4PLM9_CACFS|nr:protein prenyltransferase alpha subunit [Cavenderia fasciculata]EGG23451.1 protein prenyltransferase alpha subunit [Cavenderia fasciculata]|eukprot:XP_004361302.1 protein prenyltransferase alpha subunit [Cavenderia fasciculata]